MVFHTLRASFGAATLLMSQQCSFRCRLHQQQLGNDGENCIPCQRQGAIQHHRAAYLCQSRQTVFCCIFL